MDYKTVSGAASAKQQSPRRLWLCLALVVVLGIIAAAVVAVGVRGFLIALYLSYLNEPAMDAYCVVRVFKVALSIVI